MVLVIFLAFLLRVLTFIKAIFNCGLASYLNNKNKSFNNNNNFILYFIKLKNQSKLTIKKYLNFSKNRLDNNKIY